jgi:ABC-type multidrug transport system permease subunit
MITRRFWAVLRARNKEFLRDRASLGWNLFFPFVLLLGFSFVFGGEGQPLFKVAVLGEPSSSGELAEFFATEHMQLVTVDELEPAIQRVSQHRFDLLIDPSSVGAPRYWINSTSPKGYILERILRGSNPPSGLHREAVEGREIRYIDWFLPGLLGMGIMFSCLIGVGFVIVRYRKNGVLRRLKATPLSAFEFLSAQVVSRLFLIMVTTLIVYVGALLVLDIQMHGSHLALFTVFALGAICLISLGLLMSSRTASEELAGGLLNMTTWPMMVLSEVWFSLDGAPLWVQKVATLMPLTPINRAARAIMTDGATLVQVAPHLLVLAVMSVVFLVLGSLLFRWE